MFSFTFVLSATEIRVRPVERDSYSLLYLDSTLLLSLCL